MLLFTFGTICDIIYESSYETDNYIVTNEYGSELGELGAKAAEQSEVLIPAHLRYIYQAKNPKNKPP